MPDGPNFCPAPTRKLSPDTNWKGAEELFQHGTLQWDFRNTSTRLARNLMTTTRWKLSILNTPKSWARKTEICYQLVSLSTEPQGFLKVPQQCASPAGLWKTPSTMKYNYNQIYKKWENTRQKKNYHFILLARNIQYDISITSAHSALIFRNKPT